MPPTQYEKLKGALDEMEEREIIRKSSSDFESPLVLVWNKSGDIRICNDFRWLNAQTIKDTHPLPHPADALAALGGNVFFSTMDLTSGYYNVEVHKEDRKYTAFTSPFGSYEYNRMPQGLCMYVSVDASTNGLGAALSQVLAGGSTARPIAFVSKSLSYAQSRYLAHRLEFFALK